MLHLFRMTRAAVCWLKTAMCALIPGRPNGVILAKQTVIACVLYPLILNSAILD